MPYQRKELSDRLFSTLDRQDITMRTFSQTMIDVADTGINLPKNTKNIGSELVKMTRQTPFPDIDFHQLVRNIGEWKQDVLTELKNKNTGQAFEFSFVVPRFVNTLPVISRIAATSEAARFIQTELKVLELIYRPHALTTLNTITILDVKDYGGRPVVTNDLVNRIPECIELLSQLHAKHCSGYGKIFLPDKMVYSYGIYLSNRLKNRGDRIPSDIFSHLTKTIASSRQLDNVKSVLCHLDPSPRNMIIDKDGILRLVDFEHSSGCGAYWDVERMSVQLPKDMAIEFCTGYYGVLPGYDQSIANLTNTVVRLIDATIVDKYSHDQQTSIFNSIRANLNM